MNELKKSRKKHVTFIMVLQFIALHFCNVHNSKKTGSFFALIPEYMVSFQIKIEAVYMELTFIKTVFSHLSSFPT